MVASNRFAGTHESHTVSVPGSKDKVLRTSVIYGANGAGKSNLFRAMTYFRSMALKRRRDGGGTAREAFRLGGLPEEMSCFDLQFTVSGALYRFGFKVDDRTVVEEWIVQVDGGREKIVYERKTCNSTVIVEMGDNKAFGERLRALAKVGGPENQLFLATVNTTLKPVDIGEPLNAILRWLKVGLKLIGPKTAPRSLGAILASREEFAKFTGEFLKAASTGVDKIEMDKKVLSESELSGLLSEDIREKFLDDLRDEGEAAVLRRGENNELLVQRIDREHFSVSKAQAAHTGGNGETVLFDLEDESDGTRRLLQLMPALFDLLTGDAVYFIDEIDRSLHPMLVREFLNFFLHSCKGGERQIIVTTHESSLLDLELLRRDEIWFAEKDPGGSTRLYSMSDFRVRKDHEIRKHYLQGRFGAVPFLGDLNRLREETIQQPE
jgi:uncharacterized protein